MYGASGSSTRLISVNAGSLSVSGNLDLALGMGATNQASRICKVTITTGTVTVGGDITLDGKHQDMAQIDMSGGAGILNLAGAFNIINGTGTMSSSSTSVVNFNGTSAQTIPIGVSSVLYSNIFINNGSGATISAAVTSTNVSGDIRVQSGILNNGAFSMAGAAGKTFEVADGASFRMTGTSGMVTGFGTKTFGSTSTVEYAGANQTVSNEGYGNLTLSGSGTKTMPGTAMTVGGDFTMSGTPSATAGAAVTVNGNMMIGSGTFNGSSHSHQFKGDFSNSGTFTASTSTVTFNGTSAQAIGGSTTTTFNNLTLSNSSASISANTNFNVNGTLSVSAGSVLVPGAAIVVGGTGTLSGSGTVQVTRTAATPDFLSQYTITNKTLTNLTVQYNATGAQTISAVDFGNLTISGARTTNSVTFASSGTVGVAGTLTLSATFTSGGYVLTGSTIDYNGGGAQTIGVLNYNNLTLSNGGTKTFASGTTGIAGSFTINAGPTADATTNTPTVDYNGSGAQTVTRINYHHLTLSNSGTKTFASGTTRIAGTFTIGGSATADATTNTGTIEYNGSGAQTVRAINYHNLTLATSGMKTFAAGTTGIANTFSVTGSASGNATTNSSTINYNGGGTQNIVLMNYHHLTLSNAGTKTFATGTTGIAGTLTISGTASADATTNSTTINYNGSGAQTVLAISYSSVQLSTSGTKTFAAGTTGIAGSLTIGGTATADATTNSTTVDYNGSGAQTIAALNYTNLTVSLAGTKTFAAGTTAIAGTFTRSGSATVDATTNSSTIDYNGGGAQTVLDANYHNLTLSNAGIKTFAAGTVGIAGSLTISGSATADATTNSSTVNYNGSGAQTVNAINYHHLTLSNAGTKTLASGTVGIAGTLTISGSATANATANTPTVSYNGTGAQSIVNTNYHHLSLSGGNTKTPAAGLSVAGNFTLGASTTFAAGALSHAIQGNFSNSGTFTASTSTVTLNGTSAQAISGSSTTTFNNLTLSNTSATTSASTNFNTNGTLTVNASVVLSPSAGVLVGGSGTLTGSGTVRVTRTAATPGFVNQYTITNKTLTNLTVEYNATAAQTISAVNYSTLIISGSRTTNNITFASSGTVGISNTLTLSATFTSGGYVLTGSTIDYNGAGAQTVVVLNYNNLTLSNAGTKTLAAGTVGIAGTFTISGSATANATTNSTTVDYNAGGAQTVRAINYHNLTLSNTGTKTFAAGTTGIASTFSISGSASADATTNSPTIDYNGGGGQTVNALNYHHLTLSNAGTKTFASGTTGIAGTCTIGGSATGNATANSTTINYNGSGAQTIANMNYHHLTVGGGNTKTPAAGLSVAGNFTIGGSTTFSASSFTHTLQGNISNSGTFTASSSAVHLTGSGDASITGATTFNVLTVNKSSSATTITLNNSINTATLTMTQGRMVTGANSVTVTSDRSGNGLVIGTITRTHTFNSGVAYAFEGPDQTLTFNSGGTLPTSVTVTTVLSSPGANGYMTPIDRYYDISQTGGSGFSYTLRLHYEDSEVSPPNSETSPPLKIWRRTATGPDVWTREGATSNNTTNNWVEQTGLTSVGRFSLSSTGVAEMILTLVQSANNPAPGIQVTYTISYSNDGDGTSTNTIVTASAPVNTTYVANSTVLNGVPKTDAADADEVTVSGSSITINLGSLPSGESGNVSYKVVIN